MSRAKDIILTTEQIEHYQTYIKERVDIQEDGCWLWNKALDDKDYGKASLNNPKRTIGAHRLSYAAFNGGVLLGVTENGKRIVVRHQCNKPPCVNPGHLLIGTDIDNANDKVAAGTVNVGAKNPSTVYTEEQVKNVIESKGKMTKRERAQQFGMSLVSVQHIDNGRSWAHHPARPKGYQPPAKRPRPNRPQEQPLDIIIQTYERILEKCVLSVEPNKYTNTKCLLWTVSTQDGYGHINIGPHQYQSHQIAWLFKTGQTFVPEGMVIRHLCGCRACNNHEHVEIGTYLDNNLDQLRMGVHGTAILDEVDVINVWELFNQGMTLTDIAIMYGVVAGTIGNIIHGNSWTHVMPDNAITKPKLHLNSKLGEDDVREIRRLYRESDISMRQLSERYGVNPTRISAIVHHQSYKNVIDISPLVSDPQSNSSSPSQPDPLPPTTTLAETGIDPSSTQTE